MQQFLRAARFLLLDLASTLVFVGAFLLTQNTVLSVALGAAFGVGQIAFQSFRGRQIHTMEWLSLVLVLASGAATLMTNDPRFVLFKPSVIYAVVGIAMLRPAWMTRYLPAIARAVAPDVAVATGYAWAGVMFLTSVVNALVASTYSVETWALVMLIFGIISKMAMFIAGFLAIRLTTVRRVRAMPQEMRDALMASTGEAVQPALAVKTG